MVRQGSIDKLISIAPRVTGVTMSMDMGYEIEAIHPDGIVYAMPGMLIRISEGGLPSDDELIKLIMDGSFEITPWDKSDDEDLTNFLEHLSVKNFLACSCKSF